MTEITIGPWTFGGDPAADQSEAAPDHVMLVRIPHKLMVYWVKRGSREAHSGLHVWLRGGLRIWWKQDVVRDVGKGAT